MAAHACLKNEFTEDEKYHNLVRWLKLAFLGRKGNRLKVCLLLTRNLGNITGTFEMVSKTEISKLCLISVCTW